MVGASLVIVAHLSLAFAVAAFLGFVASVALLPRQDIDELEAWAPVILQTILLVVGFAKWTRWLVEDNEIETQRLEAQKTVRGRDVKYMDFAN